MTHIDDLIAFVREELGAAELASAREHVAGCAACREEAESLMAAFGILETAQVAPSAGFAARVAKEAEALCRASEALASTEVEAPSNFAHQTAKEAVRRDTRRAPVRRTAWDKVAWIVTRPVFGYPAWAVSAAVHLMAFGVMTVIAVDKVVDNRAVQQDKVAQLEHRGTATFVLPTEGRPLDNYSKPPTGAFAESFARRTDTAQRQARYDAAGATASSRAVDGALGWLSKTQSADGSWNPDGGQEAYRTGSTALATLALMGNGSSHAEGPYAANVAKSLNWLMGQQTLTGRFGPDSGAVLPQHAIATAAIAEAFLMTGDASLRAPLANAAAYIASARSPKGGWGASFGGSPDSVTTSWTLAALRLADAAGIDTAQGSLVAGAAWIDSLTGTDGRVGLREVGSFPNGSATPTAAGLFARRWTGLPADDAARRAAALESPAADDYINAQFTALASTGTPAWKAVNASLESALLPRQAADGSFAADRWVGYGGSTYATAMAALALESSVRYPAS